MKKACFLVLAFLYTILIPATSFATVGVGVGTGKINVDEAIRAGGIYTLPAVTVFNTGTETARYTMSVTLNEKQPQLKPDPAWFSYSPQEFTLAPKQSQRVVPTLHPPMVTKPGAYFAYLEARPLKTVKQGSASVGVAAATKLSFSITSSNIFIGLWHRIKDLYARSQPWSLIAIVALLLAITYKIIRRNFKINISRA